MTEQAPQQCRYIVQRSGNQPPRQCRNSHYDGGWCKCHSPRAIAQRIEDGVYVSQRDIEWCRANLNTIEAIPPMVRVGPLRRYEIQNKLTDVVAIEKALQLLTRLGYRIEKPIKLPQEQGLQ